MLIFRFASGLSYRISGIVIIVVGIGLIVLACVNPAMLVQIATGMIGVICIPLGYMILRRVHSDALAEKRFDQIIAKLEEIQERLKEEDQKGKTGIAIADVISSGLKYYSEQINRKEKEEK